jgi:hypothetical protein
MDLASLGGGASLRSVISTGADCFPQEQDRIAAENVKTATERKRFMCKSPQINATRMRSNFYKLLREELLFIKEIPPQYPFFKKSGYYQ